MEGLYLPDVLLRGATVGLLLLCAIVLLKSEGDILRNKLCAFFALSIVGYTIESSTMLTDHNSMLSVVTIFLATFASIAFWWCALALLADDFRFNRWYWLPVPVLLTVFGIKVLFPDTRWGAVVDSVDQVIAIALSIHVVWIAIAERGNDLLEKRRLFRVLFVIVVGISVASVSTVRLALFGTTPPQWLLMLQACELFTITLAFSAWLLKPEASLFENLPTEDEEVGKRPDSVHNNVELSRLLDTMDSGVYKSDGLTIKQLADAVDIPEHRLRKLINQELSFRNFTAFLNSYRLSDARKILSNPEFARRQITQIAFDLGYGSIAPFNRAFKAKEGMTPTEYRRHALRTLVS